MFHLESDLEKGFLEVYQDNELAAFLRSFIEHEIECRIIATSVLHIEFEEDREITTVRFSCRSKANLILFILDVWGETGENMAHQIEENGS